MITFHASRSRYETFDSCKRRGFLNYHYNGTGLQRKGKSIHLSTGIWTHKGFEMICKWVMKNNHQIPSEEMLDHFVQVTKQGYFDYVFPEVQLRKGLIEGFETAEEGMDWQGNKRQFTNEEKQKIQQYLIEEQSALVEAFMRLFVAKILPRWVERFKIVTVENDMSFPLVKIFNKFENQPDYEIIQSATIDVVLQERDTKDIYIVSFKTNNANYDIRHEKANLHDTQGLSEIWSFEECLRNKGMNKLVMGVQMLFFIKGKREETEEGSGVWETKSPLIKGYRKLGLNEVEYAHSMYFPNPGNKSGWGRLGGGWESFDVWKDEEVGGIKGWLKMLEGGGIQPECGDILEPVLSPEKKKKFVIIEPRPYYRQPQDIESWLVQTKEEEKRIAERLIGAAQASIVNPIISGDATKTFHAEMEALNMFFPQNHKNCHYPGDCSFVNICFGTSEQRENPLGGEFEAREPHHKAELVQIGGGK